MIKLYLFDIEGTTTDINFVHKVLFPYAFEQMGNFVQENASNPQVAKAIEGVKATVREENQKELNLTEVIDQLKTWIKADRKHPSLKELQGLIWDGGYEKGVFKGHLYSDVKPFFSKILETKALIGIYSSGSVHAQKLIFGYSVEGDLTSQISFFFDTKVGHKREVASYQNISQETKIPAGEIHFFSDIVEELRAAQEAGMKVTQILREGTKRSEIQGIEDFSHFKL